MEFDGNGWLAQTRIWGASRAVPALLAVALASATSRLWAGYVWPAPPVAAFLFADAALCAAALAGGCALGLRLDRRLAAAQ